MKPAELYTHTHTHTHTRMKRCLAFFIIFVLGVVNNGLSCAPGYIEIGGGNCQACTSKSEWVEFAQNYRFYCAGMGNYNENQPYMQQQVKKCPKGEWPNANLSGCECGWKKYRKSDGTCLSNITFTKDDLYYGPQGPNAPVNKQCWTKNSAEAYKRCMGWDD